MLIVKSIPKKEELRSAISKIWEQELKSLHKNAPLRYGCCFFIREERASNSLETEFRSTDTLDDLTYKSAISILCTEKKQWEKFLKKINVTTFKESQRVFVNILLSYGSSGTVPNKKAIRSFLKNLNQNLNLKEPNKEISRIPEFVLWNLCSSNDQGNPEDTLGALRNSGNEIVRNFIRATVVRTLRILKTWTAAPYEVKQNDVDGFCYFWIASLDKSRYKFGFLGDDCYNEFVKSKIVGWDKKNSFWRFVEKCVQGKECSEKDDNKTGDFLGIGSRNRGNFTDGSLIWRILNEQGVLRSRSTADFVCAECGGKLKSRRSPNVVGDVQTDEGRETSKVELLTDEDRVLPNGNVCFWEHKANCARSSENAPDRFLVRRENMLYFPLMCEDESRQEIQCFKCDACTETYREILKKRNEQTSSKRLDSPSMPNNKSRSRSNECVSPERLCLRCNAPLDGAATRTVSVPICSYIHIENQLKRPSLETRIFVNEYVFNNQTYNNGDSKYDRFSRWIAEASNMKKFEKDISLFHQQNVSPTIKKLEFTRQVKGVLIAWEFEFWLQDHNCYLLNDSFDEYWNAKLPLRNCWGQALKELVRSYVNAANRYDAERKGNQ